MILLMQLFFYEKKIKEPFLNIGTGKDYSIRWYANFIMKELKIKLKIIYDRSKPDGTPKKCLDISLAKNMDGNQIIILKKL